MSRSRTVLITGVGGFIGRALTSHLVSHGFNVVGLQRNQSTSAVEFRHSNFKSHQFDLAHGSISELSRVAEGCGHIIHCAGLAHTRSASNADYYESNVAATERLILATQANESPSLIFLSSASVYGVETSSGVTFSVSSRLNPHNAYAESKVRAEEVVTEKTNGFQSISILRPPGIYGIGAKGAFQTISSLRRYKVPYPGGSGDNLRSFLGIRNLVEVVRCLVSEPGNEVRTFNVSDLEDVSTRDFFEKYYAAYGSRFTSIRIPAKFLSLGLSLIGKSDVSNKMFGSFRLESDAIYQFIGRRPEYSIADHFRLDAATQFGKLE